MSVNPAEQHESDTSPAAEIYQAPHLTRLGDLAELTQAKTVGGADGSTFLGLDIGSV